MSGWTPHRLNGGFLLYGGGGLPLTGDSSRHLSRAHPRLRNRNCLRRTTRTMALHFLVSIARRRRSRKNRSLRDMASRPDRLCDR